MAKKKTEEKEIRHAGDPNAMGLRGAVVEQPITATLDENYMPYAMSVIVSRAIPEIDGFKPSHRKLLYTMYKMGLLTGARTKSANIVGQTMRLNPHGDAAIYDTMVRLSKGYGALLTPFVDSKGNFGKVYSRGMACAASRYTAKHHIFLPYDFIRKDTQSWYYPIEISAKLLHFITTGNKDQTTDMFALIHRENVEERSLPLPLLNMLLSDLKNTLFKARFQVLPPQSEEMAAKLKKLDERLYSPAPTFAQLEDDALCLCEFFVKVSSPSTPIPDVERYLQENYTDPSLCLSKVGDRFNISDTYLSHMFKEKTGQNFSVYLERLRMNEAARRLTSGDCSLTVLYADLGYTNPTSFRRAFKKYYGMTPSEMRDQPRKQEEKSE